MTQNILDSVLAQDAKFVSQDGILLKNLIREQAEKLDSGLIALLLENEQTRERFFIKIKDALVFDGEAFKKYLKDWENMPYGYTTFKQNIWLAIEDGDALKANTNVVINFPFKDCVLAGGQDKEDVKRDEMFYHEVLHRAEIDRLLDQKMFTGFKKLNADWESEFDWFHRDETGMIKDNLIIKGNNLLVLHSLKSNFAGKVKLIYIDPPYNTWNDTFQYNDRFNHSTWLTFMKNRLEVAKELLSDDGVIFVSIDNNEQAYLKVLMDDIFKDGFITLLPRITKKAGKSTWLISNNNDFILVYYNKEVTLNRLEVKEEDYVLSDQFFDERWGFKLTQTLDYNSLQYNKTMDYEIEIDGKKFYPGSFDLYKEREGWKFNKIDWVWRWGKEKLKFWLEKGFVVIKNNRIYTKTYANATIAKKDWEYFVEIVKREKNISSLDFVDNKFSNDNATKHIATIFWDKNIFWYSKPESLLERIIQVATNPWDIVLDYHLWSGTTCAVAHKMWRQYIGIEQMDYIETITLERMKKVMAGEQWGISKSQNWNWGWEFITMELMQQNHHFLDQIHKATTIAQLQQLYQTLQKWGFINYKIDTTNLNLDNIQEQDFEHFKQFLCEIIDKNQLYQNFSERDDETLNISDQDKKLNENFYNFSR